MRLPRDPRFTVEAQAFALRHTCEDCGFFDARSESCAHEWPTRLHRRAYYTRPPGPADEPEPAPAPGGSSDTAPPDVVLCKEFELR